MLTDREVCIDSNNEDLTPATPPLDSDQDDHRPDDRCPFPTCLDKAEAQAAAVETETTLERPRDNVGKASPAAATGSLPCSLARGPHWVTDVKRNFVLCFSRFFSVLFQKAH